jgi:hypothetical protein
MRSQGAKAEQFMLSTAGEYSARQPGPASQPSARSSATLVASSGATQWQALPGIARTRFFFEL